jgi:hypothetical protein
MIVVAYSVGSADPLPIAKCAAEYGGCVFVVDPSDLDAVALTDLLKQLGRVIVDDDVLSVASTLRSESLRPNGVVTFAESGVAMAIGLAKSFQLPTLSRGEPAGLNDKFEQRMILNGEFGMNGTPTALLRDGVPSDFNFPVFVKPRRGAGSRNTIMVARREDLQDAVAKLGADEEYVIEQALIGEKGHLDDWLADYVSVESFVQSSIVHTIGITGRLPLASPARETGLIFPLAVVQPLKDQLVATANRAILALGIENGVVHTELQLCAGGPKIIEVNPRIGGSLARLMPWTVGLDPVALAMKIACGIQVGVDVASQEPRQYGATLLVQPPYNAVELVRSPPIDEIRKVNGVKRVDQHGETGDLLDWRRGTNGRILQIYVVLPTLEELRKSVGYISELIQQASLYREI